MNNCELGSLGAQIFSSLIAENTELRQLHLSGNGFSEKEACLYSNALIVSRYRTSLGQRSLTYSCGTLKWELSCVANGRKDKCRESQQVPGSHSRLCCAQYVLNSRSSVPKASGLTTQSHSLFMDIQPLYGHTASLWTYRRCYKHAFIA